MSMYAYMLQVLTLDADIPVRVMPSGSRGARRIGEVSAVKLANVVAAWLMETVARWGQGFEATQAAGLGWCEAWHTPVQGTRYRFSQNVSWKYIKDFFAWGPGRSQRGLQQSLFSLSKSPVLMGVCAYSKVCMGSF